MVKIYTTKIENCNECQFHIISKEKGKDYPTTKCAKTGIFFTTGTKEVPVKERENEHKWKPTPTFPQYCPLGDDR